MTMKNTDDNTRSSAGQDQSISLVSIGSYLSLNDAYITRMKLLEAGFDVFLDNENLVATNPLYGPATGGIKLKVPSDQARQALKILSPDIFRPCPECSSPDTIKMPISKWMFVFAILLWAIPLWLMGRKWRCETCGHIWK